MRLRRQAGLSYLGVLYAVALAGIALSGTGALWQLEARREREKELLFIGEQYRAAIGSYYERSPFGARQYPERLEDLLEDKRLPMPAHHLRRLYRDPMSGRPDWELIRQQGRIVGVASTAGGKPVKVAGFDGRQSEFEGATSYAQWRFVHDGSVTPAAGEGQK